MSNYSMILHAHLVELFSNKPPLWILITCMDYTNVGWLSLFYF
jgi:hypothetical protein